MSNTFYGTRSRARLVRGVMAVVCLIGIAGCDIDPAINNSPNGINEVKIKSRDGVLGVFVAMQSVTGDFYAGDRSRVNSIWSWQAAGTGVGRVQPVAWTKYFMNEDGPTNDNWLNAYRGIKLANDILAFTPTVTFGGDNAGIRATLLGVAKAYKALIFGELASMYGSIPVTIDGFTSAQFVSQADAYAEAQRLLDGALADMQNATGVDQELNFQGDKDKWIAVIHSLKARYYLHVKNYAQALTEARLGIGAATGNLMAIYTDNPNEVSPWGHWFGNEGEAIKVEKSFVDSLKSEPGDKRLAEYLAPNKNGNTVGFAAHDEANATAEELDPNLVSSMIKYSNFADDFPMITYEETVLIVAECEARVGTLQSGIDAVNIIRKAAGLPDYSSTDKDATIAQVLKQKYLQLFLEGQAYTDERRTNTKRESNVPARWIYPSSEKNANQNTPADNDDLVKTLVGP